MSPSVSTFTAISGAFMTFAFGGWDQLLSLLAVAMAVDYITGLAAAVRSGKGLNSNVGFWGLARKGLMLTVILLAHRIDLIMGTDIIKGGAIYFYLVNELISITENYARIGLPLPDKLRQAIAVLKKQEDLSDREWPLPQPNVGNKDTNEQATEVDPEKQTNQIEQTDNKPQEKTKANEGSPD
ncbi:toxin secretion/phage lysis holin [Paenibacillus sp. OK003]|nr:toxin secretion/phage lysis holin [Paenibacillus sp. OK003]